MRIRGAALSVGAAIALTVGCSAGTRHKVLSFFFDGVPPPPSAAPTEGGQATDAPSLPHSRRAGHSEHGPYAARLCQACHDQGATNAPVAPGGRLCLNCHDLKLDRTYVHGPLASGGCLVCHDPHSSPNRHLLVSDSDTFCFYCHDPKDVVRSEIHQGVQGNCTDCHDAHMSDTRYLLK